MRLIATFREKPWLFVALLALPLAACGAGTETPPAAGETDTAEAARPVLTAAMLERGNATYQANCSPCHGAGGKGDGPSSANLDPKPRDHTDGEYMATLTDQKMKETILYGGVISGMPQMPSHPHIQGEEMTALIAFVRSLARSGGGPPPEDSVASTSSGSGSVRQ